MNTLILASNELPPERGVAMSGLALILVLLFCADRSSAAVACAHHPRRARRAREKLRWPLRKGQRHRSFDLLGTTRGVYLEGYGVVFSAELDLIVTPNLNPFHQSFTTVR